MLAFFDDYPNEDVGHHPELAIGRAEALHAAARERRNHVLREHTYEGHIEGISELLSNQQARRVPSP